MKKRYYIALLITLVIAIIFFFWPKRTEEKTIFTPIQKEVKDDSSKSPSIIMADRKPQTEEITYTDSGFSPSVLSVFSGDTVIFKNKSSKSFQPANDLRSDDVKYLGFGATSTIPKKGQYQFTFTTKGEYGYYDSLNQDMFGAIVVR